MDCAQQKVRALQVRGSVSSRGWISFLLGFTLCAVGLAGCMPPNPGPVPTPRIPTESGRAPALTPAPGVSGNPEVGRQLFTSASVFPPSGCATCHTLAAVPSSSGLIGPNLNNVTLRSTLGGGAVQTSPENLVRWIMNPSTMKPGAAMPAMPGITEQQARDLAAYLYSLPYNPR